MNMIQKNYKIKLQDKIRIHELPSLANRLPSNPLIVEPYTGIGEYGGSLVTGWLGLDDKWGASKISEEYLLKYDKKGHIIKENIVDKWTVSTDKKIFNFHIREGIRWSDGVLFTTEDISFFWNEILDGPYQGLLNRASWIVTKDSASLEILDDYSFRISFPEPKPFFLNTFVVEVKELFLPAHYYKNILPLFIGDDKALEIAKTFGFSEINSYLRWVINFGFLLPGIPTVRAWIAVNNPTEPIFKMERNPYYWKIDTAGNQLPYIDELKFINCNNRSNIAYQVSQGLINFQARHLNASYFKRMPLPDNYIMLDLDGSSSFTSTLQFNLSVNDLYLKKLFNNKIFRLVISHSINRKLFDSTRVEQASLPHSSKYYSESWSKKGIEYSPKLAIELLKSIGLNFKDGELLRGDNNRPLSIYIDSTRKYNRDITYIIQMFKVIGIKLKYRSFSQSSLLLAINKNETHVVLGSFSPDSLLTDPTNLIPLRAKHGIFGSAQSDTILTGDILKMYNLWSSLDGGLFDDDKIKDIYKYYEDNLWVISTRPSVISNSIIIIDESIKNLEPNLPYSDFLRSPGNLSLYQLWIDDER